MIRRKVEHCEKSNGDRSKTAIITVKLYFLFSDHQDSEYAVAVAVAVAVEAEAEKEDLIT